MESWWYLVLVLAVCLPLLALAVLRDRWSRQHRDRTLSSAPDRTIPGHDGDDPRYVPADDVLRRPLRLALLTPDEQHTLDADLAGATRIDAVWASDQFATHADPPRTILDDPLVLLVDEVGAMRELLTPLQRARQLGRPLVVVASEFESATIDTLAANRRQLGHRVLAVHATRPVLDNLRQLLATAGSSRIDLQSGYLPPAALANVRRWVSDGSHSWVIEPQP